MFGTNASRPWRPEFGPGNARATMILPFTHVLPPAREAGRVRVAGPLQERTAVVDAVVDDPDLHPLAVQPAQRGERCGADHVGAAVRGERVADVRVDLRDEAELHQSRKLARRQLDREAVQHDPVALVHLRLGNRALDSRHGGALCCGEPREIGLRRRGAGVQLRARRALQRAAAPGSEGLAVEPDDDAREPAAVPGRDVERPGANGWRGAGLGDRATHRLERRCRRQREEERRERGEKNDRAAQEPQTSLGSTALVSPGRFDGKTALVLGVANKRSIAWAIAKRLADEGASLAFTYQGERIEKSVRDLAETVASPLVTECDVRSDADLERVFSQVGETFEGGLDLLVHSVAYAAAEDLEGRFTDTPRDRFWMALDISAYSLVACSKLAEPLMEARSRWLDRDDDLPRRGARRPALQRHGCREGDARRVDALPRLGSRPEERASERDLGRSRAHARGAVDRRLPDDGGDRRRARAAASTRRRGRRRRGRRVLLSDDARNVTGTILYVDSGFHAMGM